MAAHPSMRLSQFELSASPVTVSHEDSLPISRLTSAHDHFSSHLTPTTPEAVLDRARHIVTEWMPRSSRGPNVPPYTPTRLSRLEIPASPVTVPHEDSPPNSRPKSAHDNTIPAATMSLSDTPRSLSPEHLPDYSPTATLSSTSSYFRPPTSLPPVHLNDSPPLSIIYVPTSPARSFERSTPSSPHIRRRSLREASPDPPSNSSGLLDAAPPTQELGLRRLDISHAFLGLDRDPNDHLFVAAGNLPTPPARKPPPPLDPGAGTAASMPTRTSENSKANIRKRRYAHRDGSDGEVSGAVGGYSLPTIFC